MSKLVRRPLLVATIAACGFAPFPARADDAPKNFLLLQDTGAPESIYAPPEIVSDEQGINEGGANVFITVSYLTDYIWRGIDRSESGGSEDSPNVQFDGTLKWDLGKWPHPFIGVFTNLYEDDPLSRFQEVRPYFGFELTARPIHFTIGNSNYIFPDRDDFNTGELWGRLRIDDSYFFRTDEPIFNPYVFAAWDYRTNNGLYLEFGLSHDFVIEDTPITITPRAAFAYVLDHEAFREPTAGVEDPSFASGGVGPDSGFQHYELGLEVTYGMNQLMGIPLRYGQIDLKGYLFYTDSIENHLRADTELWGGVGVGFSY